MKSAILFSTLFGVWATTLLSSVRAEEGSLDKRYVAALAKNNRLPKFSYVNKKSEEADDEPSLEETVALLRDIMDPDDMYLENDMDISSFPEPPQNDFFENSPLSELNSLSDQAVDKRNVAALARLGRLNTIRYGRFQPHYVSGKRVGNEEDKEADNQSIIDNRIDEDDTDCLPYDDSESIGDIADEVNGRQKKRYVAALARSGRLPIWHSQRMWSGKRDYTYPSYKSNSRMDIENNLDNYIVGVPNYTRKQKRCKHINQYKRQKRSVDENEDIPIENIHISELGNQEEKRNLAALARNGKLPSRYFGDGKRNENLYENDISDNSGEKRNIASLARNGKLFSSKVERKRNLAALARNGKLPQFSYEVKRNIAALARDGKLFAGRNIDGKRNIASLARNGKLPSFIENGEKRNLAALARNGKLPTFYENEGKRNLAALARNGKLPSFFNGNDKRNIQSLARNNKLPAFSNDKRDSMESDDKRNLAALAKNGRLPSISFVHIDDKRNIAALAKNGKLPSFRSDDKRNMAALAKNGRLPSFRNDDKRNMAALAKNGRLPSFVHVDDKRNMAALAKNGRLPMFDSREDKRNIAALAKNGKLPSFYSSEEKRNIAALAKNGKLPSFYPLEGKRNIAALARNGKLPAFNSIEEKREIIPVSGIYDNESKRNIAALARKGQLMHFDDQGKKRNIAALARNGKLLGYNKREIYTLNSLKPLEKWEDMMYQDDIEI